MVRWLGRGGVERDGVEPRRLGEALVRARGAALGPARRAARQVRPGRAARGGRRASPAQALAAARAAAGRPTTVLLTKEEIHRKVRVTHIVPEIINRSDNRQTTSLLERITAREEGTWATTIWTSQRDPAFHYGGLTSWVKSQAS
ncbi:hypothetical protein EVAR_70014_1 [Eumeta japonica]|uniref:Uncharacterized protein n=1 Tax=Eumeta variegata TaxID=151549 RepID=A0A4C2AGT3_EUMVA|nr:hypothetical protein EVAR_70014_1 [Eumeta japonica]